MGIVLNITIHEGFLFFATISTHIKNMEIYHKKRSTKMIFWDYNKISLLIWSSNNQNNNNIYIPLKSYKKWHKIDQKPPHHKQVYNIKILKNRHYFTNILE